MKVDHKKIVPYVLDYGTILGKAYLCVFVFTHLFFQPVYVQGASMSPTFDDGSIGLSNIASRHLYGIQRFDVVLFHHEEEIWVKRVIGLPKETIMIKDHQVYINGTQLSEPYLSDKESMRDFGPYEIPEGMVFVMGDHRDDSYDSRHIGAIKISSIISKDLYIIK